MRAVKLDIGIGTHVLEVLVGWSGDTEANAGFEIYACDKTGFI